MFTVRPLSGRQPQKIEQHCYCPSLHSQHIQCAQKVLPYIQKTTRYRKLGQAITISPPD